MMQKTQKTRYALLTTALLLALGLPAARAQAPGAAEPSEQPSTQSTEPVHTYRLMFTVTESDSGKRVGVQHFAMTAVPGRRATMRQGSKIPVMTGGSSQGSAPGNEYQFTYLDIGLNCSATLAETPNGVEAAMKVEQSSVAENPSVIGGVAEPVIRQSMLENSSLLKVGTPVMIGSLDVSGSTRHLDIEVTLERVQ